MSARSSSGSWSGAGRTTSPDIIDLDKFMRGSVRPPRTELHTMRGGDQFVVDAGGVDRKPGPVAAAPAPPPPPPPALSAPSDSSVSQVRPHAKRYSHDSGLSDTSYARRKHRPHSNVSERRHRRAMCGDSVGPRASRVPVAGGSSDSLRAFRAVCERALLDQQAQIARVAQLCERLSERPPPPAPAAPPAAAPAPPPRRRPDHSDHSVTDTSEVSSSSRSTRDQRRKDKHRTDECKTYKIIMNKLDELNKLFAARVRSPAPAPAAAPPPPRHVSATSGSVSVSDKLIATELAAKRADKRELFLSHNGVLMRGGSSYGACAGSCGGGGGAGGAGAGGGSLRLSGLRAVTNACSLDIAPCDACPRHNIATESIVQCESRAGSGSSDDARCSFDLEDPVHFYSQAKRLQAMSATTRRARSVEGGARRGRGARGRPHSPRAQSHAGRRAEQPREPSLCALCRGYWRALTSYLAAQFFCYPDTAVR